MHSKISVAVPTRHRPKIINRFITTFYETMEDKFSDETPHLTILYDAPKKPSSCGIEFTYPNLGQEIRVYNKSSLTELWNLSIILSPTDWVLICNDDIEFKEGWLEYLEKMIDSGKYDLIHLFHYGAMCIHKSMICKVGWFDERFRGGGFEDNDYQLRISEAGLKDRVDRSHDFIRKDGNREVGHFVDHTKYVHNGEGWQGCNNAEWIKKKWRTNLNWSQPSFRGAYEVNWHPSYTNRYVNRFGPVQWTKGSEGMTFTTHHTEVYH